jgi:hypothetical protein
MLQTMRRILKLMVGGLAACMAGCAILPDTSMEFPWMEAKPELPDRILSVWADTILHQAGRPGVRGFGGRLYFYKEGSADPVKVAGSMRVYVFDGESTDPQRAAPLKVFVIRSEDLDSHHSKTSLGHSYNVWVPWDVVGGPNRVLSLIVRFDGTNGGTVLGEPSTELLPGLASGLPQVSPVQQVSHVELVKEDPIMDRLDRDKLSSLTIDLPPSFQRRLQQMSVQPTEAASRGSARETGRQESAPPETNRQLDGNAGAIPERVTPARSASRPTQTVQGGHTVEGGQPAQRRQPVQRGQFLEGQGGPQVVLEPPQVRNQAGYYAARRFPDRREPRVQPGRPPLRREPHPAAWASSLPPTPRSGNHRQNTRSESIPVENGWQR